MRVGLDDRKAGISQPADVLEDFVARSHPLDFPVLAPTEPSDSPGARRVVRSNLSAKDLHIEGRLPPWLEPVEWQTIEEIHCETKIASPVPPISQGFRVARMRIGSTQYQ